MNIFFPSQIALTMLTVLEHSIQPEGKDTSRTDKIGEPIPCSIKHVCQHRFLPCNDGSNENLAEETQNPLF